MSRYLNESGISGLVLFLRSGDQISTSLSKENEKRTPLSDELNFEVHLAIEKN